MAINKRVLLVDSSREITESVATMVEEHGYILDVISDGSKILNKEFTVPNVFIIEKGLSGAEGVDGVDICRYLKSHPETAHVPLILFSAAGGLENYTSSLHKIESPEGPADHNPIVYKINQYIR